MNPFTFTYEGPTEARVPGDHVDLFVRNGDAVYIVNPNNEYVRLLEEPESPFARMAMLAEACVRADCMVKRGIRFDDLRLVVSPDLYAYIRGECFDAIHDVRECSVATYRGLRVMIAQSGRPLRDLCKVAYAADADVDPLLIKEGEFEIRGDQLYVINSLSKIADGSICQRLLRTEYTVLDLSELDDFQPSPELTAYLDSLPVIGDTSP